MKTRLQTIGTIALAMAILGGTRSGDADEVDVVITVANKEKVVVTSTSKPPFTGTRPSADVAILLDTSNSMDGLIGQAKSQLWTIVQQFATAQKNGQTPVLRVALFEYGNTNLPASEGYIRQVVPLTDNLDELSEKLFGLRTRGGDEYCGQVIDEAIERLDWSQEPNAYRAIFIAGNEPFTQGSVDYREACRKAIEGGIVVNTIHCGAYQAGVDGKWADGAKLAEGEYFNIDQDKKQIHIECPQDKIIIQLNAELNKTYLWYGKAELRDSLATNQVRQDVNASEASPESLLSRSVAKAGAAYRNVNRDLVDTYAVDADILSKVADEELPAELQKLNDSERKARILETKTRRDEISAKIAKLNREREEYLQQARVKLATDGGEQTLGDVVVKAVRDQLTEAGFEFETK
ncbi:MAG: VWA domain-containing protein [Planctomycetales bacterium]|nr:VWA domain-containing protein [Planctomycetales bacterium]